MYYGYNRRFTAVHALGLLALSLLFFWLAGQAWRKDSYDLAAGEASMKWPTTTARIKSCGVAINHVRSKTGSYDEYRCALMYTYSVKGKQYAGQRISFGGAANRFERDRSIADGIGSHYLTGTTCRVRYNPALPGESVLIPGIDPDKTDLDSWKYAWYGFGALLLTLGGFWAAEDENGSSNFRFFLILIPTLMGIGICMTQEPAFIRHMVSSAGIVHQFRDASR
jgi:hypothetical protein